MFGRLVPATLAALALLGAYNDQTYLVALTTTLLLTLLLTRFWSDHALHALAYQRETSDDRAFPGDELLLTLRLSNHKLLPLPWVEVDDRVPLAFSPTPEYGGDQAGIEKGLLRLAGSIWWNERLRWRYRLRCTRRGVYSLGPATVTSGDPFGLFPRSSVLGNVGRVVVYPRLLPLERLGLPAGFPMGERKLEQWIFEDPSRPAGVRDYRREDPFQRIHWKATARRQQLQVKLHEPTATQETVILLGVDSFEVQATGLHTREAVLRFEFAVSVAATLAHQLISQRYPVGLYLSGGLAGSPEPLELAPGGSQEQLIQILELLAGVEAVPCSSTELLLSQLAPRLPWGATVIVVVGNLSDSLVAELERLRRTGRKSMIFLVGKEAPTYLPEKIELYQMQPTAEVLEWVRPENVKSEGMERQ